MLDMKLIRENTKVVIASEKRRGRDDSNVKEVIKLDGDWRVTLQTVESYKKARNETSKEVSEMKKAGKDPKHLITKMQGASKDIGDLEAKAEQLKEMRDKVRYKIGNILHESVPEGLTDEDNKEVKKVGDNSKTGGKSHVDILMDLDLADLEKASEVSGARFYYLKNDLVRLNLAVMTYSLDTLAKKGFIPMYTPFFLREEVMAAAAELGDFRETLYKIEKEDLYMIATAEQTLAAYHFNEILDGDKLPLAYAGISSCFRREAGAHGKDTKGIFRVHQFDKVEQFVYCHPDDSWLWHEKLLQNAEDLVKGLGLPYRVVNICAGDMNDNAAKKYDIEVWMPVQGAYRELISCSNCLDYQARKIKVRARKAPGEPTYTVHTLNCTALPSTRTLVAILENFQNEDGSVSIPKALQPYMGGQKLITAKQ